MHRSARRTGNALSAAILLIALAFSFAWVGAPLVFGAAAPRLEGPLAGTSVVEAASTPLLQGVRVLSSAQAVSQPRDPFRPLIVAGDGTVGSGGGGGGGGGTVVGTSVSVLDIRDVSGVLRATIEVAGTSYDVGVGDTFANDFMVVSMDADSVVLLFRDNAFELGVGQEILK